jgi:superoxide dismutase, Fe-Mn family
MTQPTLNRRAMMGATLSAAALLPALAASAQSSTPAPSFTPVPLPFDPKTITGLSEKLLTSHHNNNYVSAVKRLGAIQSEFAKLDLAAAPNFAVNGLKREELFAQNSMVLHEIYFSCLGVANKPEPPPLKGALARRTNGARNMSRWAKRLAAALVGSCSTGWNAINASSINGPPITAWRSQAAHQCWSSTCTNMLMPWTMAARPGLMSTLIWARSTGPKPTRASPNWCDRSGAFLRLWLTG